MANENGEEQQRKTWKHIPRKLKHPYWGWVVSALSAYLATLAPDLIRGLVLLFACGVAAYTFHKTELGSGRVQRTIPAGAVFVAVAILLYLAPHWWERHFTNGSPTPIDNSLTKQTIITASPSSFPFIMGAPLGDNDSGAWQMLGLTFGPILQDYNCDLKFSDLQREEAQTTWRNEHPRSSSLPPELMANSEFDLHVSKSPKPDTTFQWFPNNPDHQHYKVEINCPDRSYDEDWEVGRVHGQLRTKFTIAKVYPFGQPPETIYSCVDHVSGRIDASTVLQPQDRYVAKPGWQPNHHYEFPVVILPSHNNNPGNFFFAMKVQNPGCWKCLQEDCGVGVSATSPQVDATRGRGALAYLYEQGLTFEEATKAHEFMYINFWTKANDPICDLESLLRHQEAYMREGNNPVSSIAFIDGVQRGDNVRTTIREARFKNYPGIAEWTGFVDFNDFIFICVLFTPDELSAKNLRKLRFLMRKVFPMKVQHSEASTTPHK